MARRGGRLVGVVGALLAVLFTGCAVQGCTLIGGVDGVAVRLDDDVAQRLADGRVHLCIDGACSDQAVVPANSAMVQTCDEQGRCADSTAPQVDNAGLFFAIGSDDVSGTGLPPRRRTVTVELTSFDRTGRAVVAGKAQVDLEDTYLNGPGCGVTSRVGHLVVTAAGVSASGSPASTLHLLDAGQEVRRGPKACGVGRRRAAWAVARGRRCRTDRQQGGWR